MLALRTIRILEAKIALPILWDRYFEYRTSGRPERFDAADGRLTPSRPHWVNFQDALRNGRSKLALRIWSSSRYNVVIFSERSR